jgi:hypothetical protein
MADRASAPLWLGRIAGAGATLVLVGLLAVHPALGATELEYKVKAAYLYNFLRFVDWPKASFDGSRNDFQLCITGRDPFGERLTPVTRKTAQSRSIRVRRLRTGLDFADCHVLFIAGSETGRLSQILRQLQDAHVLTVAETPGFAARGGMIEFTRDGDKVRLEVNLTAVRRAGLRMSSKLLEVASKVHR